MLRLPESGMLQLYSKVQQQLGLPDIVPHYGVDAGTLTSGSSRVTMAATILLKQKSTPMSAVKFNSCCEKLGLLKVLDRPSTSGRMKAFKSITEAGLKYGKNITSPKNPREIQPHWFIDDFDELLSLLDAKQAA